jgi:hypothetical protein
VEVKVTLYDYNLQAFTNGLAKVGKGIEDFSKEDIEKMMNFAIGYIDFSSVEIIEEILGELNE